MDMSIYYYDDELDSSEDPLSMPGTPKRTPCSSSGLRRGKWTDEEQAYAAQLIHDFEAGLLPLKNGTTLRAFLAKKLNCGPMRISKKYHGNQVTCALVGSRCTVPVALEKISSNYLLALTRPPAPAILSLSFTEHRQASVRGVLPARGAQRVGVEAP